MALATGGPENSMTLRRQLLLVSLLLLSLPWAGCQFIREMEGALRTGQEQSLQASAQTIAAILGEQPQLLYPNLDRRNATADTRTSLYAHATEQPVIIDGYADGWEAVDGVQFKSGPTSGFVVTSYTQTRGETLYLLLKVKDRQVIYDNPGLSRQPNGDRLVLQLWHKNRRQEYVIATPAPGDVHARPLGRPERGLYARNIRGYWQDASGGYTLELQIPMAYIGGRLGFYVINENNRPGRTTETIGNIGSLDTVAPPWLIYSPPALQARLATFAQQGNHIQIVDRYNWRIADLLIAGQTKETKRDTFWLLQLLYRSALAGDKLDAAPLHENSGKTKGAEIDSALAGLPANQRYRDAENTARTLQSSAAAIEDTAGVFGAVVVRQSSETYLSLTDQAFSRLLVYSLLAIGIGALGLLGYASLLSWRIRTLSLAASSAVGKDGLILDNFPRSRATDEIGELSRHYGDLLQRVREYNDYLRTLSRTLSHELRTPIAVIQGSLDNLEETRHPSVASDNYLQRARSGLGRLQNILTAMSEASGLEESIHNNPADALDLVPLLDELFEAYRSIYCDYHLTLNIEASSAVICGVPDLIVQALDKLMDNAASFCPLGGEITLALTPLPGYWVLRVSNEGPSLPEARLRRLFEPMVSLREEPSDEVHLGLGLHIVRLVSDFHHGQVSCENLAGNSGVTFTVQIPALAQPLTAETPAA